MFITDNRVMVENTQDTLTLVCAQKSAQKMVATEDDLIKANMNSFGSDVGKVTNHITSMYDVQAKFAPGTVEYETLAYRIQSGQQYQQNSMRIYRTFGW